MCNKIVEWNTKTYSATNANCQIFVTDVLNVMGITLQVGGALGKQTQFVHFTINLLLTTTTILYVYFPLESFFNREGNRKAEEGWMHGDGIFADTRTRGGQGG